jgi:hypothetical protein
MATIIYRRGRDFVGIGRDLEIVQGDDVVAALRPNREQVVTVAPGTYAVQARMGVTASPVIQVEVTDPAETVVVETYVPMSIARTADFSQAISIRAQHASGTVVGGADAARPPSRGLRRLFSGGRRRARRGG